MKIKQNKIYNLLQVATEVYKYLNTIKAEPLASVLKEAIDAVMPEFDDCYICHHEPEMSNFCSRCYNCLPCMANSEWKKSTTSV